MGGGGGGGAGGGALQFYKDPKMMDPYTIGFAYETAS